MKITYLGHASFLLETEAGTRIVTDPYGQDILPHPVAEADIVTMSHEHFDHCDLSQVKGDFVPVNTAETRMIRDVQISCVSCWHDEVQGRKRGPNRAYVMEADGLRIVHLGDLGEAPTPALVAACSDADALMIPVGGFFTLNGAEACEAVKALRPRTVLPMHYRCPGHSFDAISDEEPFLAALPADVPVQRLDALTSPFPAGVVLLTPQKA
jgi:L-ascorbate metabolism protein UlaG (beta-lactamase superfamily)